MTRRWPDEDERRLREWMAARVDLDCAAVALRRPVGEVMRKVAEIRARSA